MKTIIISLLLFFTVQAQTIWYVDKDATGTGAGTSWTNAATKLDNLSWGSIAGGDTVYMSDGVYPPEIAGHNDLTFGYKTSDVVICPSWEAGHTGEVRYLNDSDGSYDMFRLTYSSHIKFVDIVFEHAPSASANGILVQYCTNITFDACTSTTNGYGGTPYFGSCDSITFTNGLIWVYSINNPYDVDGFNFSGGKGGHTITNNKMFITVTSTDGSNHRDGMQFGEFGSAENYQTTIANNIFWYDRPNAPSMGSLIYLTSTQQQRFLIYNNIFYINSPYGACVNMYDDHEDYDYASVRFYNNTLVTGVDAIGYNLILNFMDSIYVKNNVMVSYYSERPTVRFGDDWIDGGTTYYEWDSTYKQIDYNFYYTADADGFTENHSNGDINWTTWTTNGSYLFDTHGDTLMVAPEIASVGDSIITAYYTTFGRDAGVDLSSEIPAYDILGNPRTGTWDAGALEYVSGAEITDTIPYFHFTDLTDAELNTQYEAYAVISLVDTIVTYSASGTGTPEFKVGLADTYSGSDKEADNADTLYVRNTSSGSYETGINTIITANGFSDTYTITTKAEPVTPPASTGGIAKGSDGVIWKDSTGKIIKVKE